MTIDSASRKPLDETTLWYLNTMKDLYGPNNKEAVYFIERIIETNDLYLVSKGSVNLLSYSAFWPEAVEYFFKNMELEKVPTNALKENIFHYLVSNPQFNESLKKLLSLEKSKKLILKNNLYKKKPLEIAIELDNTEAIELISQALNLTESEIPTVPPSQDISQDNLNNNLCKYLELTGRKANNIMPPGGHCAGWAFLYDIHVSAKNEKEFFDILEIVSNLNFEDNIENSFLHLQATALPDNLKQKYGNLETLLENIINALVVFQTTSLAAHETALNLTYKKKQEAYELVKDPQLDRKLEKLYNFIDLHINEAQLNQIIKLLSCQEGINLSFITYSDKGNHATTAHTTQNGKLQYYDSNLKQVLPPLEEVAVAEHIIKANYHYPNSEKAYKIDLNVTKFLPNNEKYQYKKISSPPSFEDNNPLGFSKLQYAILTNNMELFKENIEFVNTIDQLGATPLMWAVRMGNKEMTSLLLEKDITNLNLEDKHKNSALMLAVKTENMEILKLLLQHGAKTKLIDEEKRSTFFWAIFNGNKNIFNHLIENTSVSKKELDYFLQIATWGGNLDIIQYLIEKSANINVTKEEKTLINEAISEKNIHIVPFLIKNGCNLNDSVFYAIKNKNIEMLKILMQFGANLDTPNSLNTTPLEYAIIQNDVELLKTLINLGANAHLSQDGITPLKLARQIENDQGEASDSKKIRQQAVHILEKHDQLVKAIKADDLQNAEKLIKEGVPFNLNKIGKLKTNVKHFFLNQELKSALEKNDIASIKKCIMEGADVNVATEQGVTPLMRAAAHGEISLIKKIIKGGADIDAIDQNKRTAVMWATISNKKDALSPLCRKKADLEKKDSQNKSALIWACLYGHSEIAVYLLKKGAKLDLENNAALTYAKNSGNPNLVQAIFSHSMVQAIKSDDEKTVKTLIKLGADVNKPISKKGYTPLNLARKLKKENVQATLKSHKTKRSPKNKKS